MITRLNTKDPVALAAAAQETRERCRRKQGLPPTIEDPLVLDQLATLLDVEPTRQGQAA